MPMTKALSHVKRNAPAAWIMLPVMTAAAGCAGPLTPASAPPAPQKSAASADQSVTAAVAPWADVEKFIAAHKGKVVVVDIWSTSCVPCLREFPGLVKLHNQHAATGKLVCASVNVDYYGGNGPSEELQQQVRAFLVEQKATCTNFISSDVDETVFAKAGAPAIPIVLVYDASGQLAERFVESRAKYGEEGFSYEKHIEPLVAKLLEEEGSRQ